MELYQSRIQPRVSCGHKEKVIQYIFNSTQQILL